MSIRRSLFVKALAALLIGCFALPSVAHDIPGKVSLLVYVKPEGDRLLVLARAPMEAMTEIQFPMRGPGYLDFGTADAALKDAAQVYIAHGTRAFENGVALGEAQLLKARVALPSDKSFTDFPSALATVNSARLSNDEQLYWKQGWLDVLISFPIKSATAKFSIETDLARMATATHTVMHFVPPGGATRIFTYIGNPGRIQLDPGWWQATHSFVSLGFFHILEGIDHLLFLFCLVIPTRSVRALIPAITAFTVAHSITLISSAFGLAPTSLWFGPLIETLIALSVFYMACENIFGAQFKKRWLIVFAFGLVHGFGFSFLLADRMQFAGDHLVSALLAFNVGVELGQLVVLVIAVPLLRLAMYYASKLQNNFATGERMLAIMLSALVAHSAWHWFTERGDQLLQYSWQAPAIDASFFVGVMRWAMLFLGSAAVLWGMNEVFERFFSKPKIEPDPSASSQLDK
ncbi:MAG TPA: HupE/UreJ family protein [Steroidobacteraceae bacterium]|nr:HupE/UreJ family protein [Steroidobacteraceae bacterium]